MDIVIAHSKKNKDKRNMDIIMDEIERSPIVPFTGTTRVLWRWQRELMTPPWMIL